MDIFKKFMIVMIVFLVSCQKVDRSTTIEEYYVNVNTYSRDFIVYTKDWLIGEDDQSGVYFYYEFREPNLTQTVYSRGIMQAFLQLREGNLSPLPFDDFWIDKDGYRWTEQVTCEFRPGWITFILKYNDHTLDDPYYDYEFRVRFMW